MEFEIRRWENESAVFVNGYRVGPNPISKKAATKVIGVLKALPLEYEPIEKARKHNDKVVTCPRLRAWLVNWYWSYPIPQEPNSVE